MRTRITAADILNGIVPGMQNVAYWRKCRVSNESRKVALNWLNELLWCMESDAISVRVAAQMTYKKVLKTFDLGHTGDLRFLNALTLLEGVWGDTGRELRMWYQTQFGV
jgi:hypothetical protein